MTRQGRIFRFWHTAIVTILFSVHSSARIVSSFSFAYSDAVFGKRRTQTESKPGASLGLFLWNKKEQSTVSSIENGRDPSRYPWEFTGRLWFRPAFVRVPPSLPPVDVLELFGWTIGGVVALEYDTSPVGPYREYVTMGALARNGSTIGQWGSQLYVSNRQAESICREIWKVPAQVANIKFREGKKNDFLGVAAAPSGRNEDQMQNIAVEGWKATRILSKEELVKSQPFGNLPVYWTPTIKALWAPWTTPSPDNERNEDNSWLPLHKLRLSAGAVRLSFCSQEPSPELGISFPIGLVVDNVLIEIGKQEGSL